MPVRQTDGYRFENWSNTFTCNPELFFKPSCVEEVREVLQLARDNNKKVKVVGGGLSPSDISCTNDYMVTLQRMNSVIDVNKHEHTITVEAGIIIEDLNNSILPDYGMAFSNLGSVSGQSIGGMLATAVHGTGKSFGCFGTSVLEIDLMTADGNIIHLSNVEHPDIFSACLCHLGVLGIILSAKIQCEPAFNLHVKLTPDNLHALLNNLSCFIDSSQYSKFIWFPHTEHVVKTISNRTDQILHTNSNYFWDIVIGYYLLEFVLWIGSFFRVIIPTVNKTFFRLCYSSKRSRIARSDKGFNINCLFQQYVTEWAIPRESTKDVLMQMKDWLNANSDVKVDFPVEVRFVKRDEIMLSPAVNQDVTYIGIISYRPYGKSVEHERWWTFFEELMQNNGGRPHWAKAHKMTFKYFQDTYPQFNDFMKIRKKLDPDEIFLNNYWHRILSVG